MTLTVRPDLEKRLAAVAGTRDPQAILDEVVADYVEDEAEFMAAVQEGLDAVARGDVIPHAQVMAELDAILAEAERRARKERTPEEIDALVKETMAIAAHCSSLPVLDDRSLEELLYDENGLPT